MLSRGDFEGADARLLALSWLPDARQTRSKEFMAKPHELSALIALTHRQNEREREREKERERGRRGETSRGKGGGPTRRKSLKKSTLA